MNVCLNLDSVHMKKTVFSRANFCILFTWEKLPQQGGLPGDLSLKVAQVQSNVHVIMKRNKCQNVRHEEVDPSVIYPFCACHH